MPKENIEFRKFKTTPKFPANPKPLAETRPPVAVDNTYVHKPVKSLVTTGLEELELNLGLPSLQGEIIFVNGYFSNPMTNTESHYNAVYDKHPDDPDSGALQGENTNEKDRTDQDDIDTDDERRKRLERKWWKALWEDEISRRAGQPVTPFLRFSYTPDEKYWGYWNDKSNRLKATSDYAKFFNAEKNENFINGSHGLGSNGAHRIDHGISLGYTWAKGNWRIHKFEDVEKAKKNNPYAESFSPAYRPITVIGHSQGACMAAGVSIGIIKYAADMGYDKMPINMIYLGVHQPKSLTGDDYESVITKKVREWELNRTFLNLGDEEDHGMEFFNSLSEVFSEKYKKIKHNRGLMEHASTILGDWDAFKKRAVQFTFTNDRGDLVLRDGDIPKMDSACDPEGDTTIFSAEFFINSKEIPKDYAGHQGKIIVDLKEEGGEGGFIVLPPYLANRRFDFDSLKDDATTAQKEDGIEWGEYKTVAIRWGNALYDYKLKKHNFEIVTGKSYHYYTLVGDRWTRASEWLHENAPFVDDLPEKRKKEIKLRNIVTEAYEFMLKKYAALQAADLYAHFSPVGLINHKKVLSDFTEYCDDSIGVTSSIWDRIKKVGEDRFYRVERKTEDDPSISEIEAQKEKDKKEVDGKLKSKLLPTSIADTDYVKSVIEAFINKNRTYEKNLYQETK